MILQDLWATNTDWKNTVSEDQAKAYNIWAADSKHLKRLRFTRYMRLIDATETQLHIFGDASDKAIGIAAYVRETTNGPETHCQLCYAKAKVCQIKPMTLPRKELCAAQLAAEAAHYLAPLLGVHRKNVFLHTDSKTTLQWIQKDPNTWKQFVRNRCVKIHDLTKDMHWKWTPGVSNPADLPSRGTTAEELSSNLWMHGPPWLREPERDWPTLSEDLPDITNEERPTVALVTLSKTKETDTAPSLWEESSYAHFLRRTRILFRFIGKTITMEQAELAWIKNAQRANYPQVIQDLHESKNTRGPLRHLDPMLGDDCLLRVGGRIEHAPIPHAVRHPIILPPCKPTSLAEISQSITSRIIFDMHERQCHAGPEWLRAKLRKRFWIMNARSSIRQTIKHCQICRKATAPTAQQKMSPLPPQRLDVQSPAFTHVGVDYTGFFRLQRPKDVTQKAYIVIFTCMTSRAVHLEIVTDMTTIGFIEALRSMIARRGTPHTIYSDNAQTFIATDTQLKLLFEALPAKIDPWLKVERIEWEFNAPYAQHRGGAWERLVKTVKDTLKKTLGRQEIRESLFRVVVKETEAYINDRPLTYNVENMENWHPVTPAQICLGRDISTLPTGSDGFKPTRDGRQAINLWKSRMALSQQAWETFTEDYMEHVLPQLPKWNDAEPCLKEGDMVLIKKEHAPRARWPLARVISVQKPRYTTRHDTTRTAELRTATQQTLTRAVTKLVPLEHPQTKDVPPLAP